MKRFSRCVLILLLVTIISGGVGFVYENQNITSMYTSKTQLYVVPGEENEASVRAGNGGLNNDFMIIFTSNVVISAAQKQVGTSEDIAKYLKVRSPENSNIVEITCTNPDQNTAKNYVDAVAQTAIKTTSIIPVKSIQILTTGTSDNKAVKPDLYKNVLMIVGVADAICLAIEIIFILILGAFKPQKDNSDDELEYEKYYGKYAALRNHTAGYLTAPEEQQNILENHNDKKKFHYVGSKEQKKEVHGLFQHFDEEYTDEDKTQETEKAPEDNSLTDKVESDIHSTSNKKEKKKKSHSNRAKHRADKKQKAQSITEEADSELFNVLSEDEDIVDDADDIFADDILEDVLADDDLDDNDLDDSDLDDDDLDDESLENDSHANDGHVEDSDYERAEEPIDNKAETNVDNDNVHDTDQSKIQSLKQLSHKTEKDIHKDQEAVYEALKDVAVGKEQSGKKESSAKILATILK